MKKLILIVMSILALCAIVKADDDKIISVSDLPQNSKNFINEHFGDLGISFVKLDNDFMDQTYEVTFVNGQKAKFDKNGEWKEIDCKYSVVPSAIVPEKIREYVTKNYPNVKILEIEKDKKGYEVKLGNGLELKFNMVYELYDIDD